ncbi:MAG: YihY family inner membrane protein [Rhodanobacter sp.]|nr:MAG: YihY family inner membrane protein [Rhodanobacter sp.]TAM08183.1 MAG: YihY family inner membrane protein [Rhodanobacter sp.]TAM36045.1 MAG: YihY family inner membrane protein [Rhodanobacter sp.]
MKQRFDRDRLVSFGRFLWRRFVDDKCFETAGALSYTTLVSLVPLTVAMLAMFAAFPMFAQARGTLLDFVFRNFVPAAGERVQETLIAFAANASKLTGLSILVMLFSAIAMMVSIEDRLNRIWRVHQARRWGSRLLLYWAALTLGPILVVGGIALTSYVTAIPLLAEAAGQLESAGQRMLGVLPFVVTFATLWLMYGLIPNCRVAWRKAVIGALLGAVLFELARWGFARFVHHAHSYSEIYGALAVIPIFLLWIYLSWIIVILGASIAASASAFDYQPPAEGLPEGEEFLGLMIVLGHFVSAQRRGATVDAAAIVAVEPRLRGAAVAAYFDDLARADLIQRSEAGGWLLSRALDSADLLRVYRHSTYRLPLQPASAAAALGLDLPMPLLAQLDELADAVQVRLGTPLATAFPAAGTTDGHPET